MACLCKDSVSVLAQTLQDLEDSEPETETLQSSETEQVSQMARAMLNAGIGFNPDPDWQQVQFPDVPLNPGAVATLSAFGQLQTTMSLLGLNLTDPYDASEFAQLTSSVAERLAALEQLDPVNPAPWSQASSALQSCNRVQSTLQQVQATGCDPFVPGPANTPVWSDFLDQLQSILPMLSVVRQLGLTGNISTQLATALKTMLAIPMPPLPPKTLTQMASLTSTLTAVSQIKPLLGVDPVAEGLASVQQMVQERVQETVSTTEDVLNMPFEDALQSLKKLHLGPTMIATPLTVSQAANLQLPPINWQIPTITSLPVLHVGLPIAAFMAQLKSALNVNMAQSPCMAGCDMAALGA